MTPSVSQSTDDSLCLLWWWWCQMIPLLLLLYWLKLKVMNPNRWKKLSEPVSNRIILSRDTLCLVSCFTEDRSFGPQRADALFIANVSVIMESTPSFEMHAELVLWRSVRSWSPSPYFGFSGALLVFLTWQAFEDGGRFQGSPCHANTLLPTYLWWHRKDLPKCCPQVYMSINLFHLKNIRQH